MAVFTRTSGNEGGASGEFFGRDIQFLKATVAGAGASALAATQTGPNCALATIVKAVQNYATVSIVGTPASNDVVLAVEGLSNIATVGTISTAANAALVAAGFTSGTAMTVTFALHETLKPTF